MRVIDELIVWLGGRYSDRCNGRGFYADPYDFEECLDKAKELRDKEKESSLYLPKITENIADDFYYLIEFTEDGMYEWSQDAVDFACLLNQHRFEQPDRSPWIIIEDDLSNLPETEEFVLWKTEADNAFIDHIDHDAADDRYLRTVFLIRGGEKVVKWMHIPE